MIEDFITSSEDGRITLAHPALEDAENIALAQRLLTRIPGIVAVIVPENASGTLIVEYNPDKIRREQLLQLANFWLKNNIH